MDGGLENPQLKKDTAPVTANGGNQPRLIMTPHHMDNMLVHGTTHAHILSCYAVWLSLLTTFNILLNITRITTNVRGT